VLALGEGIERKMTQPVRTSRTGEYRIEGLPPGSYRVLLLEENGMRTVRAKSIVLGAGEEHRLDFEYPRDASVSGTVSESGTGRPIRGARLSLSWKPGEELFGEVGPDAWVPLPLAKVTGSDGSYRLDRLIPGTYRIEVNHGGHQPAIREVMVDEGANAEDCEIRLSR
jgi:protocatechuate 3,4-dioxygenase beta subunit